MTSIKMKKATLVLDFIVYEEYYKRKQFTSYKSKQYGRQINMEKI